MTSPPVKASTSNQPPSPGKRPDTLPFAGPLTKSEIEQLRQSKKELHAWLRKEYPNAREA